MTDVDGNKLESREATFATALPDGTYASWQGAQWIGSQLFEQEKYASWLYPVKNGATSVWERWNSYTVEDGFGGNNSMNSYDHFSLGAIAEWMMRYHLGIDHEEPGWQKFVLAPVVGGSYTSAKGSFHNPWGTVESGWE